MRVARWVSVVLLAGLLGLPFFGCSDDGPSEPDPVQPSGYRIQAWLGTPPQLSAGCEARIVRLDPADSAAATASVEVNGVSLPLLSATEDGDTATFRLSLCSYAAGTDYLFVVSLSDTSDTCRFAAPALGNMQITSPGDEEEFTPGLPLELAWQCFGTAPDSVCVVLEFAKRSAAGRGEKPELSTSWFTVAPTPAVATIPGETTAAWVDAEVYISLGPAKLVGSFQGSLAAGDSYVGARAYRDQVVVLAGQPLPPGVVLADRISTAPPGEANGHSFARMVVLDPDTIYVGGARIEEDTCIRGESARINLAGQSIVVVNAGSGAPRFDIDHCLIVGGRMIPGHAWLGGGIIYFESTRGWVVNNTFYNNRPFALYLHPLNTAGDAVKVINNIFYTNGWGLVRNVEQPDLYIRHNDCYNYPIGIGTYGSHTGCGACDPDPIAPGELLHVSNKSEAPGFVELPSDKRPGDFHLAPGSPCIGTGEDPLTGTAGQRDKGAFPYLSL
ncbi:MAG: right-handed parallel beta-helix repeat-containing protein [Candidatus Eisenbacteria bacterium]